MAFNGTGSNVTSLNASNIASGTVPTARLGSGTANSTTFLRGDQTYATPPSLTGSNGQVFTSSGTFTVPTGVTSVKVTVVGGGGNGGNASATTGRASSTGGGGGGGGGGVAVQFITGLTPGGTVSVTVGGISGTSSFGAFCSATGGASAAASSGSVASAGGVGGTGSGGNFSYTGSPGQVGLAGGWGGIGGASLTPSIPNIQDSFTCGSVTYVGVPGSGFLGGRAGLGPVNTFTLTGGGAASGFGNGGAGAVASNVAGTAGGGAGSAGVVLVEW